MDYDRYERHSNPFPIFVGKEGKWFVASCPTLDLGRSRASSRPRKAKLFDGIATQGKTEQEVKGNMRDLINEYLNDPDTVKPE